MEFLNVSRFCWNSRHNRDGEENKTHRGAVNSRPETRNPQDQGQLERCREALTGEEETSFGLAEGLDALYQQIKAKDEGEHYYHGYQRTELAVQFC
jgi:hypothetical protein